MFQKNHFINGQSHFPQSGQYFDITNPCTGEIIAQCARGNASDAEMLSLFGKNALLLNEPNCNIKRLI
jgi:hypothetical protein